MTIARLCQRQVDTAQPEESVRVAAKRMASRGVGALLVLDLHRKPIGIVTDRDLALRVCGEGRDPNLVTVAQVMTPDPTSLGERAPLESALDTMRALGIRRLPVVDTSGEAVGIVTLDDIVTELASEMKTLSRVLDSSSPRALAEP
jgi:CBS domain-containing protein